MSGLGRLTAYQAWQRPDVGQIGLAKDARLTLTGWQLHIGCPP
jgi:hypothetical protein